MIERQIKLESGDRTYVLSPSLEALRAVSRRWPRMEDSIADLRGLNFDACALIVGAASGLKQDQAEKVVHQAGLAKSTAACVELLAALINPEGDEAEESQPGNP